jgi:hypothetical protein
MRKRRLRLPPLSLREARAAAPFASTGMSPFDRLDLRIRTAAGPASPKRVK